MRNTVRWRAISVSTALLSAVALAGCTGTNDVVVPIAQPANARTQEAPSAPDKAPDSLPELSDLPIGTVVATGTFDARGVTGSITINTVERSDGMEIVLSGISPAPPEYSSLELSSLPESASDSEFREAYSYYRYDVLQPSPDQTFSTPGDGYGGFDTNDPSYMRTAVIYAPRDGTTSGLGDVFATAALTWDLPDMNPGLRIEDQGSAEGANGTVSLAADGSPLSYQVAPGDTSTGVTARFGVTEYQLEWLNPDRGSGLMVAGITINLSREHRGLLG